MTWDWKHLFSSIVHPKDYIRPVCPICHALLDDVPLTDHKICRGKDSHRFGHDMKRVPLINEGDHHGDL